jgi:hypothetical protein
MQAANLGAARRYVPAGYAGPLDLVSSRSPADRQSLAAAWDALTTGGVRVHATAPNVAYQRRLHEPHVGMLAGVVRELLDRARADTGP